MQVAESRTRRREAEGTGTVRVSAGAVETAEKVVARCSFFLAARVQGR